MQLRQTALETSNDHVSTPASENGGEVTQMSKLIETQYRHRFPRRTWIPMWYGARRVVQMFEARANSC